MTAERPRVGHTITTAEQLDALPRNAVILDDHEHAWQGAGDGHWFLAVDGVALTTSVGILRHHREVTVLYVPGEEPCPMCSGSVRQTVGMVCQTCGTDYSRPSVTDNARAEEQSEHTVQQTAAHFARRVQQVSDRIRSTDYQRSVSDLVALDNVEGFLDRIARDDLDVCAAGRAETTTATDEDAGLDAVAHHLWSHYQGSLCGLDGCRYQDGEADADYECECPECWTNAVAMARGLAGAGLLATARTRPADFLAYCMNCGRGMNAGDEMCCPQPLDGAR